MVGDKCQGLLFKNTLFKFLLKSDSILCQRNRRVSDCEELVGGFKGYEAEMLVGTLISGRSISGLINEAEFINLFLKYQG